MAYLDLRANGKLWRELDNRLRDAYAALGFHIPDKRWTLRAIRPMSVPPWNDNCGVRLEQFESLVYGKKHEEAVRGLLLIVRQLKRGDEFSGYLSNDSTLLRLYTRLAAAITALIADPDVRLTREQFDNLAVDHSIICAVYRSSVFRSTDYLLRQLGSVDSHEPGRLIFVGSDSITKMLLMYGLDSQLDIELRGIFESIPEIALPAFLGRIARAALVSPAAHARANALLALGPLFEKVAIEERLIDSIAEAYFYCSYVDSPEKHRVKRSLNILLRRFIESRGLLPEAVPGRQLKDRPTVLVPLERFSSVHAMYRCYAPNVRKLRERFKVIALGPESELDDVSRGCFDEVIALPNGTVSFPEVLAHAQAIKPDVIYYPSVGMSPWVIAMSTLRLAPIQAMTIGHPATTLSPEMDYVLVQEAFSGGRDCFSETVIVFEGALAMSERFGADFPKPSVRDRPDVIQVAVPAAFMKLNAPFVASCQAISRKVNRQVQFQFFPYCAGLQLFDIAGQIRKSLPGALVHPAFGYNEYLRVLGQCDVHLSTFPFGGTNSNIDSMRLGLPMVALEGPEAHSRTDSGMMRAAGIPDWLITRDTGEFETAAVRLIENDVERVAVARHLLSIHAESVFFDNAGNRNSQDFLDSFLFICKNHEEIRGSDRRYWTIEDRGAFSRR